MSDQLTISESVVYQQESPAQTSQLLNISSAKIPVSHNSGRINLAASTIDFLVATNVNICVINSSDNINIKIGGTTKSALIDMTILTYSGMKTSFHISNSSTEDIQVDFVVASL